MFTKRTLTLLLIIFSSSFLFSQIRISTDFDSGSIGSYRLVDSAWVKRGANDSILTLTYEIESRFDPLNPIDTALRPSARWYHFKMEGVKDKQLYLTIKNSEVIRPFYSYDGINYTRFETGENVYKGFINKIFTRDTVYISHFVPYPYSRNRHKVDQWRVMPNVKHEIIGTSYLGLPIEMLTITDESANEREKKRVWIHSRSHPSESPASWHMEAMVDIITSDTPFGKELRKNTIFYIVPFINPDGVMGGFSRSSSTGVNIEINWDRPDSLTMPEIKILKKTLERVTSNAPMDLMLNMHSQISSSVTYWIHTAESTTERFLKEQLLLSSLTINYSPYYRPVDQSFSAVAPRYFEGWIWDRFRERSVAITFETPYTFYNQDRSGTWVSIDNLRELAYSSLYAISDMMNLGREDRILLDNETAKGSRNWEVSADTKNIFFGDTFFISQKEGAKLRVVSPTLQKGNYELFRWVVGPADENYPEDTNIWVKVDDVTLRNSGKVRYRYKSSIKGEKIDSFLLLKRSSQ
ncbi:MAG: M14-type cytosolic carboxypeptidase [Bacteroidales bacterium]|nr:M14-type cytosolic carboxypeptidase [Bacteroidales bacterium]